MAELLRHRQTKEAVTDMFTLQPPRHIPTLPWPFQNAFGEVGTERRGDLNCFFASFGYALIAAISGWIPMMFITLVRL